MHNLQTSQCSLLLIGPQHYRTKNADGQKSHEFNLPFCIGSWNCHVEGAGEFGKSGNVFVRLRCVSNVRVVEWRTEKRCLVWTHIKQTPCSDFCDFLKNSFFLSSRIFLAFFLFNLNWIFFLRWQDLSLWWWILISCCYPICSWKCLQRILSMSVRIASWPSQHGTLPKKMQRAWLVRITLSAHRSSICRNRYGELEALRDRHFL